MSGPVHKPPARKVDAITSSNSINRLVKFLCWTSCLIEWLVDCVGHLVHELFVVKFKRCLSNWLNDWSIVWRTPNKCPPLLCVWEWCDWLIQFADSSLECLAFYRLQATIILLLDPSKLVKYERRYCWLHTWVGRWSRQICWYRSGNNREMKNEG